MRRSWQLPGGRESLSESDFLLAELETTVNPSPSFRCRTFLSTWLVVWLAVALAWVPCCLAQEAAPTAAPTSQNATTVDELDRLRRPEFTDQIAVEQNLGAELPLDLRFHDERNNFVSLGDFFDGRRPVVLSFNYSDCPRLCIVQFNNFVAALNGLGIKPNQDFQIVSISLDPKEKPGTAAETKRKYLASYGDMSTAEGWHFLVGSEAAIEQAAAVCGIRYVYVPEKNFYSHPAAFIFCSPSGKIVRYLNGLDGELAGKLKPAIVEASQGRVGSAVDRALYFSGCYIWDPASGKYTGTVMRIMRLGGILIVVAILAIAGPYWLRGPRRSKARTVASKISEASTR